jgi:type I restriction enzyme S subunit
METSIVKLEDICNVSSSKRIFAREYAETGVPFWRGKEVTEHATGKDEMTGLFISEQRYEELINTGNIPSVDDVLITAVGTIGSVYQVKYDDLPFYFKDGNIIRLGNWVNKRVIPTYVCLYLRSNIGQQAIKEVEIGSTQKALTIKDVARILIPLPKIDIQKKIASIIETIDLKIQLNQQINKNLLKLCRLQFDKYKQTCSATTELSNIATLIMGQSPKGDTYNQNGEGTPLLNGAADFRGGINPSKYTSDPKKVTEPGDYVFGVRATIGLTTKVFNRYAIGRGTGLARALSYKSDELLYFIMEDAFSYFARASTGSVYLNISRREFETYAAPDFSNITIKQFHEFASPLMQQIYQNQKQNKELTQLRELLLPRLLAGDIDLSNIETVMNNA